MLTELVRLENEGPIWLLTIQRPEALNALNAQVLNELAKSLEILQAKKFSEAQVLIVTGAGEKAFVAGADIKEIHSLDEAAALKFAQKGQSIFRQIEKLKIPVIAAVNGFALGGGLELALSCDFIFASENARFGLPEVSLGLIPGFGGTVRLSKVLGPAKAKEWIYTGKMMMAVEALQMGLVNQVVPASELLSLAKKTAAEISSRGPLAVAAAKESIQRGHDLDIDQAMAYEAQCFQKLFSSHDVKEGTAAFVEKRKAQFKGN
jgi:enoyl-CoA hydratase